MNKVFYNEIMTIPMSAKELAQEANAVLPKPVLTEWDYDPNNPNNRLSGSGHCNCAGDGEFVLLPGTDPDVQSSGKRYMYCRKCGCWSHL